MKTPQLLLSALSVLILTAASRAGEEVDRLLAGYAKIETVTCQVRRTKEGDAGKMKFLSRVYWSRQNKIHAEGIAPLKRRTIADGTRLWQYVEGDPKGFSRPIGELSEQMTISLQLVPGTAMDHLLRLKGLEETPLPPGEQASRRVGIQTENHFVVLQLDESGRLVGIEFFKTEDMKEKTADYVYRDFTEALPDVWIPLTHQIKVDDSKVQFEETVKVDRFTANQPIAESLFIASSFFDKNIDFVDDFAKIFPE